MPHVFNDGTFGVALLVEGGCHTKSIGGQRSSSKSAHAFQRDQTPIAERYKAGGPTHLAKKTNKITTRPRTLLSVQLGIGPPNMVKYQDLRAFLRGGEKNQCRHRGSGTAFPSKCWRSACFVNGSDNGNVDLSLAAIMTAKVKQQHVEPSEGQDHPANSDHCLGIA